MIINKIIWVTGYQSLVVSKLLFLEHLVSCQLCISGVMFGGQRLKLLIEIGIKVIELKNYFKIESHLEVYMI